MTHIDGIRARLEKATKGKWSQRCQPCGPCGAMVYDEAVLTDISLPFKLIIAERPSYSCGSRRQTFDDMVFIAHAHQDIPDLLDLVTRARDIMVKRVELGCTCAHCTGMRQWIKDFNQ